MMYEKLLIDELLRQVGSDIEVSTDTVEVEGLLEEINGDIVTLVEPLEYGSRGYRYIPIEAINFIRVL